jgi:chromosome segregation ATPase
MSTGRILSHVIITLVFAVLGASVGVCWQALRITGKPQEFRSLAKLVAGGGGNITEDIHMRWRESQMDFYGTIIETIESAEVKRRALERVRALNPELKDIEVDIRVAQTKGSAIFNILATGPEPKYTRIFLDALLDEFIAFRQNIREQSQPEVQQFLRIVATQRKKMEDAFKAAEALAKAASLRAKADLERLVERVTTLKGQRDDLRLELKAMADDEAARASLEKRLKAISEEIALSEAEMDRYNAGLAEYRRAVETHNVEKETYQKQLEKVNEMQSSLRSRADYVAIQERATLASENVEDWKLPIAIGAVGGGSLGAVLGFLLSLIITRPASRPLPPTV